MKKTILIVAALLVSVGVFGLVSFAYAQTPTPPVPQTPFGPGMRGGGHMNPGGMWGMRGQEEEGPMHEYMQQALAETLGISVAELEAAHENGKTFWQLAEEKGLSAEQVQAAMVQARQKAVQKMVDEELLTQEQADWMLSRMQNMWGGSGARGGCPGMGGDFTGPRGRRGAPQSPSSSYPSGTNF